MFPELLKRTSAAKPVKAVFAALDNATTLSIGEADGVASKLAVKVPAWLLIALFTKPPPALAVTQTGGGWLDTAKLHTVSWPLAELTSTAQLSRLVTVFCSVRKAKLRPTVFSLPPCGVTKTE